MKTVEVRHPLVQHKIGLLRQAALNTKDFRELVTELGTLLAYEATADLATEPATMDGWAGPVQVRRIAGAKITVVPILRAGLGMLPGVLALIPAARVSVVGLQRDEATLQPVPYFERLTGRLDQRDALILDPMLATGGTLIATIGMLKRAGARRIKGIFLVAAPEGLAALEAAHPDVEAWTRAATSCPAWAMPATASSAPVCSQAVARPGACAQAASGRARSSATSWAAANRPLSSRTTLAIAHSGSWVKNSRTPRASLSSRKSRFSSINNSALRS